MAEDIKILQESIEMVEVDSLEPHPENPRVGDIGAIINSMRTNGFFGALIAQKSTRRVLVGNHRLHAATWLKMPEVPVIWIDVDDVKAKKIMLADNRVSDLGSYNDDVLLGLIKDLTDEKVNVAALGYDDEDIEDIIKRASEPMELNVEAEPEKKDRVVRCPQCNFEFTPSRPGR